MSVPLDSIFAKCLSFYLKKLMKGKMNHCYHMEKGQKAAVRIIFKKLKEYKFFYKSDVKSYYASIKHNILLKQVLDLTKSKKIVFLLSNYLKRPRIIDGCMHIDEPGLIKGCPLSPILGAIYLLALDESMSRKSKSLFYIRFQDDILFLTNSKPRLNRAKLNMYKILHDLELELRYEKTQIGRIPKDLGKDKNLKVNNLKVNNLKVKNLKPKISDRKNST